MRVLGAGVGLAVGVGTTIGSGILRAPADVAAQLPDLTWIIAVWVAGGIYALLGAISMAEVATLVARSGGFYPIARRGLGGYAGFVVGWLDFAAGCGSLAALALLVGDNADVVAPFIAPYTRVGAFVFGHGWSFPAGAAVVLVAFAALQWGGVVVGGRAQVAMSLLKGVAFLALVVACFFFAAGAHVDVKAAPMPTGTSLAVAVAVALQGVIYTYDGWYSVIYLGEEVRDPGRDIPRSLFFTVAAVTIIQLLVVFAFLAVLPIGALAASKTPAADAAAVVVGGQADRVIAAIVVLSLAGALNATLLGTPRVLYAMARDKVVPSRFSMTTAGGTPLPALGIVVVVAFLFLASGTFERVAASLSVLMVGMYASFFMAVFVLRRTEPETPRPFRAWGYPVTTALGLALSLAFIVATAVGDWKSALMGGLILVLGVPAYFAQQAWQKRRGAER